MTDAERIEANRRWQFDEHMKRKLNSEREQQRVSVISDITGQLTVTSTKPMLEVIAEPTTEEHADPT